MEKTGNLSRVRGVFKEALIWLPFFGFFMHARGILYVDRTDVNWKNFDAACRKLHRKKIPFSMLIYPEGTVMNWALDERNVWEKNRAYARSNGEQPFEYVLFPRYRGLFRLLKHLRGNTQALYDFTIIYESTRTGNGFRRRTPSIFDIAAIAGSAVHIHLRRIDIKDVPEEEEEFKRFLIERFAFKERLADSYIAAIASVRIHPTLLS
ncbi:1-acyl-sn-glycerol-3-phosphate acyltransferase epsilon-like [Tropilaelaps mercedesae]|uniref:1-acyl-sn-glycerol-3-phosphate acyltransferase epsilon-like n=1 Tax=Tropilaelaps mercedesae TaxID=418985 RepID=A0A1V9XXU1_9ACAR|nr:1-acyl-sn-glycerol-3-phosphate acyltransferase epsilon-like [Tropilaelaps mercedesae]